MTRVMVEFSIEEAEALQLAAALGLLVVEGRIPVRHRQMTTAQQRSAEAGQRRLAQATAVERGSCGAAEQRVVAE